MLYEYDTRTDCERRDSLNQLIIAEYVNQTGIAAKSVYDMKKAFEIKNDVRDQMGSDLRKMTYQVKQSDRRKKGWKTVAIVGIPVSFSAGVFLTTKLILK